jgi:hypothetical protein
MVLDHSSDFNKGDVDFFVALILVEVMQTKQQGIVIDLSLALRSESKILIYTIPLHNVWKAANNQSQLVIIIYIVTFVTCIILQ